MSFLKILIYLIIFWIGFLSCVLLSFSGKEIPLGLGLSLNPNSEAPGDWIKESQIHVYENAIVIDVDGASISRYAPTGSMKPVLDESSTGIRIKPTSEDQINIGDIITFEQNGELIVHRVVDKGQDGDGAYFITKGDNNNVTDGKVRFADIRYITIGILW
jgi:hypothetical protein